MSKAPWSAGHPSAAGLRRRSSARLLVLDSRKRVLLFRFVHKRGPLAGQDFWATPGGGLEADETFEQAAVRELAEETGLEIEDVGLEVFRREPVMQMPDGEFVVSDERYYLIRIERHAISRDRWTDLELEIVMDHRWWSLDDLQMTEAIVFPENLAEDFAKLI